MTTQLNLFADLKKTIENGSPQRRTEILVQVTNLFVRGSERYSDAEIALFDDVITLLAKGIEVSVRALLANCLAPLAKAPLNIIRLLSGDDDITVAGPILTQSVRLDDGALLKHAREKSQAHLLAISKRKSLSERITDVLIERGNREVVLTTAKNPGAQFSKIGFTLLVKRCQGDDVLATCVGSRRDVPDDILLLLLTTASELVRSKLIAEHPQLRLEIDHAVEAVTDQFRQDAVPNRLDYTAAQASVRMLKESGQLSDATVRVFADEGRFEQCVASVADMCDVPISVVERAFLGDQSETLLVLVKAARLLWPTAKSLLAMRARKRGRSLAQIGQGMASFERLSFEAAQRIVDFYRIRQPNTLPNERASRDVGKRWRTRRGTLSH